MSELGEIIPANVNGEMISFMDAFPQMCALHSFPLSETVRLGAGSHQGVHLDRDQVRDLVTALTRWLYTGSFASPERVEVVVVGGNHREFAYALVDAFEACESPTVIVVDSAQRMRLGVASLALLYDGKDITFKLTDPALAPVGECECGAERAAENGRCGDGCDDE